MPLNATTIDLKPLLRFLLAIFGIIVILHFRLQVAKKDASIKRR